jgi:hypothetical protein
VFYPEIISPQNFFHLWMSFSVKAMYSILEINSKPSILKCWDPEYDSDVIGSKAVFSLTRKFAFTRCGY